LDQANHQRHCIDLVVFVDDFLRLDSFLTPVLIIHSR